MAKSLNVMGAKYKLVYDIKLKLTGYLGLCCPGRKEISILPGLSKAEHDVVLLHELLHACADRIGMTSTSVHPDVMEILCDSFGAVVQENFHIKLR